MTTIVICKKSQQSILLLNACLPPTSRACYCHWLRVHHQANTWIQLKTTLNKEHYVFKVQGGRVFPIFTDMEAVSPSCCSSSSAHAKALKTEALPSTVQRKDYHAVFTTNVKAYVKTACRHLGMWIPITITFSFNQSQILLCRRRARVVLLFWNQLFKTVLWKCVLKV
jgi:hypothetical protein